MYPDCHWSTISNCWKQQRKYWKWKSSTSNAKMPEVAFGKWDKTQHMESRKNNEKCKRNMVTKRIWTKQKVDKQKEKKNSNEKKTPLSVQTFIQCWCRDWWCAFFFRQVKIFHADNVHFSFLSSECLYPVCTQYIYTCDENGFYSLPLYPCRLLINSGSSTARVYFVYRIGRTTNVRYVIAQHLVIINTFTSFHSITE